MPTGFTQALLDNPNTPFEVFALRLARGMGALINMRDEPLDAEIPDEFEPDAFYRENLEEAEAKARDLEAMTLGEADRREQAEFEKTESQWRKWGEDVSRRNAILHRMLAEVEGWTPPTPDHEELKRFMREQLTISLDDPPSEQWRGKRRLPKEWLDEARKKAAEDVRYHREKWEAAVQVAKERTRWIRELRASLRTSSPKGEGSK
jgi:hypothetical protein